jgi:type IV secretion system protein VirD4
MSASLSAAPAPSALRRLRLAATVAPVGIIAASWAATQFVAWRLGYHPWLGQPWFGHVYAPWAVLQWARAPWAPQAAATWTILRAAALGTVLMGGVAAMARMQGAQKPIRHEGVHGTARFATEADLPDSDLKPPAPGLAWPGVYAGAWQARDGDLEYLSHYGPEHVLCLGPLRSGKAVACVVPTLLAWPHSTVVYDEKGELWEYASGWRKRCAGNVVIRWEPRSLADTAAWNPLDEVRLGTDLEYGDVANIVEILADPGTGGRRDPHFDAEGGAFLIGLVLHVLYERAARGDAACLADVAAALSDPARPAEALYNSMVGNRWAKGERHPQVAQAGQAMLNKEARERTGVHSTASRFLALFRDPIVGRNTSRSDVRIGDLMNHACPVSLFIVTRGEDKTTMKPLVRLFLTMAMGRLCSADLRMQAGQQVSPHGHRLLMLIDEFASLGRLDRFQDAMAKCAGYGIKVFLLAQSREQIVDAYGPHESITSNCHVKVLFAPNDEATARWVSGLLGEATVIVEDVSESGGKGAFAGRRTYSRTYRTVKRPVMTPDEVMRLRLPVKGDDGKTIVEAGDVLIHLGGRFPVRGVQSLYFRDPEFSRRVRIGRVAGDTIHPGTGA